MQQIEICLDIETIPNQKSLLNQDFQNIINRKLENQKDVNLEKYCSLNWEFNQIICIGLKINNGETITFINDNEQELLFNFWLQLSEYRKDVKLITFNGKRFDVPIINLHSSLLNVRQFGFILSNRRYDKFNHFDVLEILTNFYQNQNFLRLQDYCKIFGIENNDISIGSNIYKLFKEGNLKEISEHCREDIEATKKLYDRIKNYL